MKNSENELRCNGMIWEYLVDDFLEMACFLRDEERRFLIKALTEQEVSSENLTVHPCFSIDGKVVVVLEDPAGRECWLYEPRGRKISKHRLPENLEG